MRMKLVFACIALAFAAPALAAPDKPLFASSDPIHIAIQGDIPQLVRNRQFNGTIPATLVDPNGQNLPVTLALRGITRRTSEVCNFPPLRVEFPTPPPATSLFAGQKKLKLVTHCRNTNAFRQYVLLEYSAYRMYNLLTPRSFRAKLADVDYRDASGHPIVSQVGYFLEELGDVARRNGMKHVKAGELVPLQFLSPPDAARFAMFEHMIGNHDWSLRAGPKGSDCCHNNELIGTLAPGQTIPIPYDFDFSGLVDTPYATPPAALDITDVTERHYAGYCVHNSEALAAARQMRDLRAQILGVLTQVPGLDAHSQGRAGAYLASFFADVGTDSDVNAKVLRRCYN